MDEHDSRTDRIIAVAMELAEEAGYDNVRLRDLADRADVALGTVYRRFSSKEDILAAALERMVAQFRAAVMLEVVPGASPGERISRFFEIASRALAEQPRLSAAMLRTVACGVPEISERITRYQRTVSEVLIIVLRGEVNDAPPTDLEDRLARIMQGIWFAELVGWTGGLRTMDQVIQSTKESVSVVGRGLEYPL